MENKVDLKPKGDLVLSPRDKINAFRELFVVGPE